MYYILNEKLGLCGYQGLPFGLDDLSGTEVRFYNREQYEAILMFDGETDVNLLSLTAQQKNIFDEFLKKDFIQQVSQATSLKKHQKYRYYSNMYKESAMWSISGACNYRCRHCFMSAPDCNYKVPDRDECMNVIEQLSECGVKGLTLTGGEPLTSPWVLDVLDECNKKNIHVTGILTNAALLDDKLIKEIKKRSPGTNFQISFDGVGWHDWLRGIDGAEQKAIEAFRLIKENGMKASATMCLHKHNLDTINNTIRLLDSLGVVALKMNTTLPSGLWIKETEHFITDEEANEYMLKKAIPEYFNDHLEIDVQFGAMLRYVAKDKKCIIPLAKFSGTKNALNQYSCGNIKKSMYISSEGTVLPCMPIIGTEMQEHYQNLYETPLKEILSDSYYFRQCYEKMKDIILKHEECISCRYRLICGGGCRACTRNCSNDDFYGTDQQTCRYFMNGWYRKSMELIKQIEEKGI